MQLSVAVLYLFALFALARAQLAAHNEAGARLAARQDDDTAAERAKCATLCNPPNAALRECAADATTRTECMCKPALGRAIYQCTVCLGRATKQTDYTDNQAALDSLVRTCAASGITMPVYTLPGQVRNRPGLPSASARSTATTPSSTPTTPTPTPTPQPLVPSQQRVVPSAPAAPANTALPANAVSSDIDDGLEMNDPSFRTSAAPQGARAMGARLLGAVTLGTVLVLSL
ncbi:hypothetical protein AURDEDRAFT_182780 [Auricularia subglabra TFB-10046 SS5]|nr:hypothetical protein AURDEDRAFT_182780 [Auricularia subglabra TFB-10046 SS5]